WMLDEFQDGHFSLNGYGNAHFSVDILWELVVPAVQAVNAARLNEFPRVLRDDLDSSQLTADAMAAKANHSRGALSQGLTQLPGANMGLLSCTGAGIEDYRRVGSIGRASL